MFIALLSMLLLDPRELALTHVNFLDFQINPDLITSIVFGSDDKIYLAALSNATVFSFDKDGKPLPTIGRKGEGPGEFRNPMYLFYDEPFLYVLDIGRGKVFRVDSATREILQEWSVRSGNNLIVKNGTIFLSFNMLANTDKIVGASRLTDPLSFDTEFFERPCCLDVAGAKSSALLLDRDNHLWVSYSGEYRVERYSLDGTRTKLINHEPPEYVVPTKMPNKNFFDRDAMGKHFRTFDKMRSLYEVGDRIVLYRAKFTGNARLDVFNRDGNIIQQNIDISGVVPFGVHKGMLYGFREADGDPYDVELVKIEMNPDELD